MTTSEDVVATALRSVIADYGWNVVRQPARLRAALNDQLAASAADHRASVDALVVASEEGVAARLRTAPAEDPAAARQHVRALVDWGLSEGTAEWVVGTWSAVVPPTSLPDQPTARNGFPPPVAGDAAVPAPPPWSLPGSPQPVPPVAATALPDQQWAAAAPPGPDATALPPGTGPEAWVPAPEDWVTPPGGWAPPPGRTPAGGDLGAPWQPGPPATELPGGAWPNQPGRPPDVRRNSRSRLWLWIAAAVVVALALGAAGYLAFSGDDGPKKVPITLSGRPIDQPDVVLAATESIVAGIVKRRHGAAGRELRCYYAKPTSGKSGTGDVENSIFCGPVLFVDGTGGQEYLQFALKPQPAGKRTKVSAGDSPVANDPSAPPAGLRLVRPDGRTPPPSGKLGVPQPPAASGSELLAVSAVNPAPAIPDDPPVMGARSTGVTLASFGPIERYGSGDAARTAPAGGQLIAFTVADGPCDNTNCRSWSAAKLTLAVTGMPSRPLPAAGAGDYFVVAVPAGATSAVLEMNVDGYHQTLSVLTGKAGPGNITYMRNRNAFQAPKKSFRVTARTSLRLTWPGYPNGVTSRPVTLTVSYATRYFFLHGKTPRSPANAFLYVRVDFKARGSGKNDVLNGDYMLFVDRAGHRYRVRDLDPTHFVEYVFEVPASVLSGTLIIGGHRRDRSTTGNVYVETIPIRKVALNLD